MLAAEGALVLAHQRAGFFGDGAHLGGAVAAHVEDRPHVQRADRRVRVPGAAGAVPREHFGQRVGVVGQMLERHRAVLDEAHRLAVALQAHHDVEAGLAHFPQVFLRRVVGHLDHAAGQAEVAHQLDQVRQLGAAAPPCRRRRTRPAGSRAGWPISAVSMVGRKAGLAQAQLDHRAVDQLHRRRDRA